MNADPNPTTRDARRTPGSSIARAIGAVLGAAVLINAAFAGGAAWADDGGTLSSLGLSISADGSAPFDADDLAGDDSGATNGIVRTHDTVTYRWDYTVATAGAVTFTQTLPAGMIWRTESTASCAEGAAAISGSTLTCTISESQPGVASYGVTALVGGLANGTVLSSAVAASGLSSAAASTTVSAAPRYQVELTGTQVGGTANGAGAYAGQPGYVVSSGVSVWASIAGAKGAKGVEPLGSSYGFDVSLNSSTGSVQAVSSSCSANNQWTSQPSGSGGGARAVPRTGTIACAQPDGAGGTVHVTLTGADTSLTQWPSQSVTGIALAADRAYVGVTALQFWVPKSAIPANAVTRLVERLSGFDPDSASAQSNYGTAASPNQQAGAACVTSAPANCNTYDLSTKQSNLTWLTRVWQAGSNLTLPGGSSPSAGDSPAYPGQKYDEITQITNPAGNDPQTAATQCIAWDETQQHLDPDRVINSVNTGQRYSYAHVDFVSSAARKAFDCVNDSDITWSTSASGVAGGTAAVNAIRIVRPTLAAGVTMGATLPFVRTTNALPVGTPIPLFTSILTVERPTLQPSLYNESTNANADWGGGNRVLAQSAQVRVTAAWDASSAAPGSDHTITLHPTVTANGVTATAASTVLTLQLPSPCVSYVSGSASVAPTSVTAGDLGADGVACSDDDGAGSLITWNLGSVTTGSEPTITLAVGLDPLTDTPSTSTVTALVSSPTDTAPVANRSASATIGVNAVAAFSLTLQSSTSVATPNQSFDYTIGWANERSVSAGTGSFALLLPAVGDGRGTTGVGAVRLESVTPHFDTLAPGDDGVQVLTTTDAPGTVAAALAADPSGATGITWSSTLQSGATAIRLITPEIERNARGTATVTVTPLGLASAGRLVADIGGSASRVAVPLSAVSPRTIASAASTASGTVYADPDYSFSRTAGEAGVGGVAVRIDGYGFGPDGVDDGGSGDDIALPAALTATTASDGTWSVDGLAAGRYSATILAPAGDSVGQGPGTFTLGASAAVGGLDGGLFPTLPTPVAVDDSARMPASGGTVPVLANDTGDASLTVVGVGAVSPAGSATVAISADGTSLIVAPLGGYTGAVAVTYTVRDKAHQSATATATARIIAAPTAADDSAHLAAGGSALVDVLGNDTGDALALDAIVSAAGVIAAVENGRVHVTAIPGFDGAGSVVYRAIDSVGQTVQGTVAVIVNAPLTARDDRVSIDRTSTGADLPVLANDGGTGLRITSVTQPAHGTAMISADGQSVHLVPDGTFHGHDALAYTVADSLGATGTARVEIAVLDGAAADPVAVADAAVTPRGAAVTVDVLANDIGQGLELTSLGAVAHGTATITGGRVVFTPDSGFEGTATVDYTAADVLWRSVSGTLTIDVETPAITLGLTASTAAVGPRGSLVYSVHWSNALRVSAGTASIVLPLPAVGDGRGTSGAGALGLASVVAPSGVQVLYTTDAAAAVAAALAVDPTGATGIAWTSTAPAAPTALRLLTPELTAGASGTAEVTVTLSTLTHAGRLVADLSGSASQAGRGRTGLSRVTVTSTASALSGSVYLDQDYSFTRGPLEGGVAAAAVRVTGYGFGANGVDDGNTGDDIPVDAVAAVSALDGGWTADGLVAGRYWVTVTPPAGFTVGQRPAPTTVGPATAVSGADAGVFPSVAAPVAASDRIRLQATGGLIPAMANDTADASARIWALGTVSPVGAATATISSDGRSIVVIPRPGFTGLVQVPYTIRDKARQTSSSTATARILPVPLANDDFLRFASGSQGSVAVLANDTGLDLRLDGIVSAAGVAAAIDDDDIVVRALDGVTGSAELTYRVVDTVGQTAVGTVDIVVNEAVVGVDDRAVVDRSSAGIDIPVLDNDGGTDLTISSVDPAASGTVAVSSDGRTLHYVPDGTFTGHLALTYRIADPLGASASAQLTIAVTDGAVPDPAAADDALALGYGTAGTVDVLANDLGQRLEITRLTDPRGATASVVAGRVLVVPDTGFTGRTTFTYTATDILWREISGTVTVTVGAPAAQLAPAPTTLASRVTHVVAAAAPITATSVEAATSAASTTGTASTTTTAQAAPTTTTAHGVLAAVQDGTPALTWWWLLLLLLLPVGAAARWWFVVAARRRRRDEETAA